MNKKVLFLLAFTCYCGTLHPQSHPEPKSYVAYRTIDAIDIDGKADEESWGNAPKSDDFIDIEGLKKPTYQTNVKMIWDDDYLYFYAKMEEPHIWGTLKQRDTVIFYNNDFEIFIDPDGDTHNYYEFEINALNTVWDLLVVKPYRESGPVIDSWDIQGLKTAVHIDGTLNDPSDEDKFWSVEVAIPWEVLKETNAHGNLPGNEFWRINFSRVNWDFELENGTYSRKKDESGNFLPEYNWVWSPQWVVNMHEPEKWGYVYFSYKQAGEQEDFIIPNDEEIKWILYDYYRSQKKYFSEYGSWATTIGELQNEPLSVNKKEVHPELEIHKGGWNISITSPYTKQKHLIREDGKYVEP